MSSARPLAPSIGPAPVLIVGAGPTGLVLACVLRAQGIDVRLVDAARRAECDSSRATTLHAATLELLDRVGIAAGLVQDGRPARASQVWRGTRRLAVYRWHELPGPYPFLLNVPQAVTEARLRARLAELGGEVLEGIAYHGFEPRADGVRARLQMADGASEELDCDFLIGCDGAHSAVRESLDLRLEGATYPEHFILADVHADGAPPSEATNLFVSTEGPLGLIPLPGGLLRLNAALPEASVTDLQQLADRRMPGWSLTIRSVRSSGSYRIHRRIADHFRRGRVFLCGDAAHVNSPIGGQGMNLGMRDAFDLGWKLGLVLQHGVPEVVLDSYQAERRPAALRALQETDRLTRLVTARGVQRMVINAVLPRLHRRTGWHRRTILAASGLIASHRGSAIVDRARRRRGLAPGDRLSGRGGGLDHQLLLVRRADGGLPRSLASQAVRLEKAHRIPLEVREVAREPGFEGADLILLRPDGHVAWLGGSEEGSALEAFLARTGMGVARSGLPECA